MRHWYKALAFSALLSTSVLADASPQKGPDELGNLGWLFHDRVVQRLELSDEQRTEIRKLMDDFRALYPRNAASRRDTMSGLMAADQFDYEAALEMIRAEEPRRVAALELRFDIGKVLTESQRAELKQIQQKLLQRRGKHH